MEKRRQELNLADSGYLKPLGRSNGPTKRPAASGLGEDLGNSNFKSTQPAARPKLAANPRGKPKQATQLQSSTGSDTDPIDFLSSQEPISTRSTSSAQGPSKPSNRTTPQPPPFAKKKSTAAVSSPPASSNTTRVATTTTRRFTSPNDSEQSEESSSGHPVTRAKSRTTTSATTSSTLPQSSDGNGEFQTRPVRQPAPAPFGRPDRPRREAEPDDPPKQTLAILKPAPPPFKKPDSNLPKPKRAASQSLFDASKGSNTQSVTTAGPMVQPVPIHMLPRIPKKGRPFAPSTAKAKESPMPAPKRVPAEFPMAAYAREAAAKMTAMDVDPPSPRKRFRPEDIERLLQSSATLDDSINLGDDTLQYADPEDLCPFCDELLPDNPSPDLLKTLAELKQVAQPEPRVRNPLGLTAPLTSFINLCHMHRAESTYVQQGRSNGWPVTIDWDSVQERLRHARVVDALQEIISDPRSSVFFVTLSDAIKRQGVLKAASIKAQLDNFELSHPGYYGEQGTLVFFDVLTKLFPDLSPEDCKPLQPREFFLSVLVPEAAALLVEEDMNCTHEKALKILRESRQYGQVMFPDRGDRLGVDEGASAHMDDADAKQLQWRREMIQPESASVFGADSEAGQDPRKRSSDDDILVID